MKQSLKKQSLKKQSLKNVARLGLVGLFVGGGFLHFLFPDPLVLMIPPYFSSPLFLVYASGVVEMALGSCLLFRAADTVSRWTLTLLLIAVFPANLYMAMHASLFPSFPPALLWLRLPFQPILIYFIFWMTQQEDHGRSRSFL